MTTQPPPDSMVIPIRRGAVRGFALAGLASKLVEVIGRLEPSSDAAVLKRSRNTLVFSAQVGGRTVVVKRQRPRRFWRRLLSPLRGSRAVRGHTAALALRRAWVRVPRPLAALDTRCCGWLARSELLCERVATAETLHAFLGRLSPGDRQRVSVARRLGRLLGLTHAAGYRHRDLKAPNFLVGPGLRVWLVDLDGLGAAPPERIRARRERDLARLLRDVRATGGFARAEAGAFARAYVRAGRRSRARSGGAAPTPSS